MRAMAAAIVAGHDDVTFQALAKASGVPERTLYRYYPAKGELSSAFWVWLNERLGMPPPPQSPEELLAQVPEVFAAFDKDEALVRAMLHDAEGRATRLAKISARRQKLEKALGEVLEGLESAQRRRLLAGVQALFSAAAWETMKDYCGVTASEAADAAQWGIGVMIAAARREAQANRKRKGADGKTSKGTRKI